MIRKTELCKKCNTPFHGNYCSYCGNPIRLKRINRNYIIEQIVEIVYFEKGILYTIKELLTRPGENVKRFLTEDRKRLVKPVIFVIVTSLIYTLINHYFKIEEEYIHFNFEGIKDSFFVQMLNLMQEHYGYFNLIMSVFIAFWIKLFFKKYDYNYFEILILLFFVIGIGMLIYSAFAFVQGITNINLMKFSGMAGIAYMTWAIGGFFDKKKVKSYFKAVISYLFGMVTFLLLIIFAGIVVDLMLKQ